MRTVLLAALLCLLVGLSQAQTEFVYTFDNIRKEKSYNLGWINNGTTVKITFTTQGIAPIAPDFSSLRTALAGGDKFMETDKQTDTMAQPAQPTTTEVVCVDDPATLDNTVLTVVRVCEVIESNYYRINIDTTTEMPSDNSEPQAKTTDIRIFVMDVVSYPTLNSSNVRILYKNVEIFRDRIVKIIYSDGFENSSFTLFPIAAGVDATTPDTDPTTLNGGSLGLFKISSITYNEHLFTLETTNLLGFTAATTPLDTTSTLFKVNYDAAQNQTLFYNGTKPLPKGYYALTVAYSTTAGDVVPFIRVTFDSFPYACPYNSNYQDYYMTFQPCLSYVNANGTNVANVGQPGFPCLSFENATLTCIVCFDGFRLIGGKCVYNDTCPDRFYFHFGECLPVDPACGTYEAFTGKCLTCVYNDSVITNGVCIENPVVCGARQVVVNKQCISVSVLCATWKDNGDCLTCITGFEILPNATVCTQIVISCASNQYAFSGVCINIPVECVSFNRISRRCSLCQRGYWPSGLGVCQKIICPVGQVPSTYGIFCINVSPLCLTWDDLTGDCLSCKNADATIVNGECKSIVSPLAGCAERQRLGFGECVNPQLNCQRYNLVTRNCEQCMSGYFIDYTGRCLLNNEKVVCQADEVRIQGVCHQRPNNCLTIDSVGLCQTCQPNYRNIYGQCHFFPTCGSRQYQTNSGVCVDVSPSCATFNPSSGACLTCVDGRDAVQGICCSAGSHAFNGNCIGDNTYFTIRQNADTSLIPTCISYHPTLKYCIECSGKPGQFKVNPFNNMECIAA